jgi:hypothetical protein
MATTAALQIARANRLEYLVTADAMGGALTIPNDAGVTPDLQTDTVGVGGLLRQMILARLNGYGAVAAGALSQAQARSIFQGEAAAAVGNAMIPRAQTFVQPRTGATAWIVDWNVDGAGDPVCVVTATAAAGTAILVIEVPGAIGSN